MMNNEFKYVFQFRGPVRNELCSILDLNDKWRELAAWLGYSVRDVEQIDKIARNRSQSDVLLELWGQKAPTMNKLFIALSEIQHYQALMLLKDFVPEEFHVLIYEGEENLDTKDDEDEAEAESESECFSSSDSNNIVTQDESASKQLASKLLDIKRAITVGSTSNKEICQLSTSHTSESNICNSGRPRFKLLEQQQGQTFIPNVIDHEARVKDMFHRIADQEDVASAGTVSQSTGHTELAISAPPACFVPPEVINAPTSNSPAFSDSVPLSPWLNSEPYCKGIVSQVECQRINPSAPNLGRLEKNPTFPEASFSTAGMLPSSVSTPQSSSGPAKRVLGSSLASKKLLLGAL